MSENLLRHAIVKLIIKRQGETPEIVVEYTDNGEIERTIEDDLYWRALQGELELDGASLEVDTSSIFGKSLIISKDVPVVNAPAYERSLEYWCSVNGERGERLRAEFNERGLDLSEVYVTYNDKLTWKCNKCGSSWKARVSHRTKVGSDCPYCKGTLVSKLNSLKSWCDAHGEVGQRLLNEYSVDNEKNIDEISYGSGMKVKWVCSDDPSHKWEATVSHRTACNSGCPYCANNTSFPEQYIYYLLSQVFVGGCYSRSKLNGIEADILIDEEINGNKGIVIEYNGQYFHKDKSEKDALKRKKLIGLGYRVITIQENNVSKDGGYCEEIEKDIINFYINYNNKEDNLNNLVNYIIKIIGEPIDFDLDYDKAKEYAYKNSQRIVDKDDSILALQKELIEAEWDYENNTFKPDKLSAGSWKEVNWVCSKCGFKYAEKVRSKIRGASCPNCMYSFIKGKYIKGSTKIFDIFPMLKLEIDQEKNSIDDISNLSVGSCKKVHWKCNKCGHTWNTAVVSRTTDFTGCPSCSWNSFYNRYGKDSGKVGEKYPELIRELADCNKISKQKFSRMSIGSKLKVVWECTNCGYAWEQRIISRITRKRNCSVCGYNIFKDHNHFDRNIEYPEIDLVENPEIN